VGGLCVLSGRVGIQKRPAAVPFFFFFVVFRLFTKTISTRTLDRSPRSLAIMQTTLPWLPQTSAYLIY